MKDEMKRNEISYQISMSLTQKMLSKGLINHKEYKKIEGILLKKYEPYISELLV